MGLKLPINYLHELSAASRRKVFVSIYICFRITHSKLFFWFRGVFEILIFQFLNVFGMDTTKQCIVIHLVVDFLKGELNFFQNTYYN